MKKLTTFLKTLEENGGADLIETTDDKKTVLVTELYVDSKGEVYADERLITYNQPFIISGNMNDKVEILNIRTKKNVEISQLFARLIKANFKPKDSLVLPKLNDNRFSLEKINEFKSMAKGMLQVSNHTLVGCCSTSLDYLETFLTKSIADMPILENTTIDELELDEDTFMRRLHRIQYLSKRLANKSISEEEYKKISEEWNNLYDDYKPYNVNADEKKRDIPNIRLTKQL